MRTCIRVIIAVGCGVETGLAARFTMLVVWMPARLELSSSSAAVIRHTWICRHTGTSHSSDLGDRAVTGSGS